MFDSACTGVNRYVNEDIESMKDSVRHMFSTVTISPTSPTTVRVIQSEE
jgi:hypothetical protein